MERPTGKSQKGTRGNPAPRPEAPGAAFSRWTVRPGCRIVAGNHPFVAVDLSAFRRDWWPRYRRQPHFWYVIVSALLVTVAIVILRKMEHPWEGMTAKRIRLDRPWMAADYGRYWGFWIGLGTTILVAAVTIASRWWWSWAHPPDARLRTERTTSFHRHTWLALAGILLLAAWIRVPQLNRPILRDEQDTLRYHIHGYHFYDQKNEGRFTFHRVTWAEAAFGNEIGNNPVLMSVASKAALELWQEVAGAGDERFSRIAVRLPPLLAGLLSIATLAWCVLGFASRRVALLAALVAAIHPLHIEYCEQARGYAFVMLGATLTLGGAIRALRDSRWRHWIALVGGSAMMLYAYLGSLFFVAPLALAVVGIVAVRGWRAVRSRSEIEILAARRDAVRLVVTGLIGVGLYLVLALPSVICFWEHREKFPWKFTPSAQWWLVFWTEYASGRLFQLPHAPNGETVPLPELIEAFVKPHPLLWLGIFVASALTLTGLVRVWRKSTHHVALLVGIAFLAPFLQIAVHGLFTHMVLFFFYLIYWLPVVIGLEAWGADGVISWLADRIAGGTGGENPMHPWRWRVAWTVLAALFLAFILRSTGPDRLPRHWGLVERRDEPEIFDRGDYHWIVYPEGRTLKLDRSLPVPPRFPDEPVFFP